jgi:uncharacterized membrane protein YbaN (DUF454 family)
MNSDLNITKNRFTRALWLIGGFISTGLGIAGYIVPVMPGTTFIIIALYCFAKSNERWYNWILNNRYFGQTIRDFKDGKGMSKKAKRNAYICIVGSISISLYFASNWWVAIFLIVFGTIAVVTVSRQKTKDS